MAVINNTTSSIRRSQSCAINPRDAVREFHAGVVQPDMELVVFFCSNEYDRDILTEEMNHLFTGVQIVGCTTAGEIGPAGYREHSLAGASFRASEFTAVTDRIDHLQQFEFTKAKAFAQTQLQKLKHKAPQAAPENSFALLLIDGMSVREEQVTSALQSALVELPLVGGSAADGLNFGSTHVYFEGRFHLDSAVMILVTTPLPFKVFKIQHFVPTDERLVVTEADAANRIVKEINGLPAAEEYARAIGVDVRDLNPMRFAASPVVVLIDNTNYVRSIQKANADGSLTFFCAIEEGLTFRMARGVDLVENMQQSFTEIQTEIGAPQLVLSYDCILRKLEISQNRLTNQVGDVFIHNNAVGFATYGEQVHGVHVNQTLTGIALGNTVANVGKA